MASATMSEVKFVGDKHRINRITFEIVRFIAETSVSASDAVSIGFVGVAMYGHD